MAQGPNDTSVDPLWYKDAIIYELHVKTFCDSDGDGMGDFRGLIEKLDYLQELGVTAIWLLPFYPSPLRDDGYDIADYYNVHPSYGTLDDFRQFLEAAHEAGLKVITELVLNHTSDQHIWFQRSRRAVAGDPWRDYYVWSDDPNKYQDARIIFKDTELSNWTYDPVAKSYFWHRFYSNAKEPVARTSRRPTSTCRRSEHISMRNMSTGCSWRKPISGRTMRWHISGPGMNVTWHSIFRSCRGSTCRFTWRIAIPS